VGGGFTAGQQGCGKEGEYECLNFHIQYNIHNLLAVKYTEMETPGKLTLAGVNAEGTALGRPLVLRQIRTLRPVSAAAKELESTGKPMQNPCPSVAEASSEMRVPDGCAVRNFASGPMVVNPVAMTWDHRGRLRVVELFEYPSGAKTPTKTATRKSVPFS